MSVYYPETTVAAIESRLVALTAERNALAYLADHTPTPTAISHLNDAADLLTTAVDHARAARNALKETR